MVEPEQLSLSWDAHQKSICNGLSLLQQRGEFVDMTLAADGHHVKVHQMVLSLVSPYIKDLISTAQCPHPVIFLNNISYTTLCAILEYVYTGEVLVPKDKLADLINAGKALHIRGLREMDVENKVDPNLSDTSPPSRNTSLFEKLRVQREKKKSLQLTEENEEPIKIYLDVDENQDSAMDTHDDATDFAAPESDGDLDTEKIIASCKKPGETSSDKARKILSSSKVHYTVSNQGGLQSIYNRYIYRLRYISKKNRKRSWRCVDYDRTRCPANICSNENDQVTERMFVHTHPFHDKRILKKLREGTIYTQFQEAEITSVAKKKSQCEPESMPGEKSE